MKDYGFVLGELLRFNSSASELLFQFWDHELGIWLTLARTNIQEEAMAQGIPVLHGPYVVNFGDIPHHGNAVTIWTPQPGSCLLALWGDPVSAINWDTGGLDIGTVAQPTEFYTDAQADSVKMTYNWQYNGATVPFVLVSASPVQVRLHNPLPAADPTMGHVELYALVCRSVAP